MALLWLMVSGPPAEARINPLTTLTRQVQRPNMLMLLDTSTSMIFLPGEKDLDFNEAGPDCDNGDQYCRTVGTQGRCFMTSGGMFGAGVRGDNVSCTTSSQCTSKGYCKNSPPSACDSDSDCSGSATCKGKCSNNLTTSCNKDADCGSGRTCRGVCSNTTSSAQACTTDDDCGPGEPCALYSNDSCITNSTSAAPIKMCKLSLSKCLNDSYCTGGAGDTCGPASSRMVVAKRALNQIVQDFYNDVNFGFMTFTQSNYYPYFQINSSAITYQTRTVYLDQSTLESATTPCFTSTTGPAASCSLNGVAYTLVSSNNSRYRLNQGTYFSTTDTSWSSTCQSECLIANVGTGLYQGSYYTFSVPTGTPTSTEQIFTDYAGKTRSSGGKTWMYFEAPVTMRNSGNIYENYGNFNDPIDSTSGSTCSKTMGAFWNSNMVPFMDTALTLSGSNALAMSRKLAGVFDKASFGGAMAEGSTPTGCAFKNEGTAATYQYSAYHYLQKVKADNGTAGVPCRPTYMLFVTDGMPNGPGENDCASAACSASPPTASCDCKAVQNAYSIYKDLGVKLYVVGFSGAVKNAYATAALNNMAAAGGTKQAFFAVAETELYNSLSLAIYDAIKGSYATSPIAVGASDASSSGAATTIVLDSRADFPTWKGHLVAYDVSGSTPAILWDAATYFDANVDPAFWKKRNVWTSNGYGMVKIQVDSSGAVTNASTLRSLGFGATDAEAALVVRWMLGDPALKNPAVLGAIVNSTPTQIGRVDGTSLTYVGSSDGMLHAFHSKTQTIGGTSYPAGSEAFAYIPQDMIKNVRHLYAQGGQMVNPNAHVFGLANSPKVKRICTANCTTSGYETWQLVLVMPEGLGGNDIFALDVTNPVGPGGVKSDPTDPPVVLLWNTEYAVPSGQKALYDAAMGNTISLPGFYFGKSTTRDDYRSIFASGYTNATNSSTGLILTNSSTATGTVLKQVSVQGMGAACTKTKIDPTEPTLLADVAVARRFGSTDLERIAAAYVGDTWGNLFRYVPTTDSSGNIQGTTGALSVVDSFTCSQPIHYPPTVVQLDRNDNSKHPGEIYIAQVTNSPLDPNTDNVDTNFPASQIIIRKDVATAGSTVAGDSTWGTSGGRIVLSASNPAQICGVWNSTTNTCTTPMPSQARPFGSPTAILRDDFDGFSLVTLWYVPDPAGCSDGSTYLTIHEINASQTGYQIHGEKLADEPVMGAAFAAGKLMVVTTSGPKQITSGKLGTISSIAGNSGTSFTLVDRYRRMGWTELP